MNGKGTHGRKWYTDETGDIAFSLYIETNCKIEKLERITIEMAETLVKIFKEKYNINLNIKYPNDITYNNKKIGGILTESKIYSNKIKYLVIGIGINVNKENFTKDIENIATSIKKEFEIEVDKMDIIASFCNEFEKILINKIKN